MEQVTRLLDNHPTALECVAQQCPDTLRKSKYNDWHKQYEVVVHNSRSSQRNFS